MATRRSAQIALALAVLLGCIRLMAQRSAGPRDGVVTEYGRQTPCYLGIGPIFGKYALLRGSAAGVRLVLASVGLVTATLLRGIGRRLVIALIGAMTLMEIPQLSNDVFL